MSINTVNYEKDPISFPKLSRKQRSAGGSVWTSEKTLSYPWYTTQGL